MLYPPISESVISIFSTFHELRSAKREYILNRSPTQIDASSPPAPGRISTRTSFSSDGSFGSKPTFIFVTMFSISAVEFLMMSSYSLFISSSVSSLSNSSASDMSEVSVSHCLKSSTIEDISLCFFAISAYLFGSLEISTFDRSSSNCFCDSTIAVSFLINVSSMSYLFCIFKKSIKFISIFTVFYAICHSNSCDFNLVIRWRFCCHFLHPYSRSTKKS